MSDAGVSMEETQGGRVLRFAGPMLLDGLAALRDSLPDLSGAEPVTIDLGGVGEMDTAGAWLVLNLQSRLEAEGVQVRLEGANERQTLLLESVASAIQPEPPGPRRPSGLVSMLDATGQRMLSAWASLIGIVAFLGQVVVCFLRTVVRPSRLRVTALTHHMQEAGLNAAPIVGLMAFLIGVVMAYMGAAQLRQFGAEIFVVDLVTIAMLRELGILMAAIIVAGRSASAYAAAIGSMKLREEIDAMRTLGIDPMEVLVLPRVLALVIMLPILAFFANVCGLLGGALMAWIDLDISPALFVVRMLESSDPWHFIVGISQAPFFALIIAVVGCSEGLKVERSAESLGSHTSDAVVLAIFLLILANAFFSIFFMQLGV